MVADVYARERVVSAWEPALICVYVRAFAYTCACLP